MFFTNLKDVICIKGGSGGRNLTGILIHFSNPYLNTWQKTLHNNYSKIVILISAKQTTYSILPYEPNKPIASGNAPYIKDVPVYLDHTQKRSPSIIIVILKLNCIAR